MSICLFNLSSFVLFVCLSFQFFFQFTKDHVYLPPREQLRWQECKDAGHLFAGFKFSRTGVYSLYFSCVRVNQQACGRVFLCIYVHVWLPCSFSTSLPCSLASVLTEWVLFTLLQKNDCLHIHLATWRRKTARDDGRKPKRSGLIFQVCALIYIFIICQYSQESVL